MSQPQRSLAHAVQPGTRSHDFASTSQRLSLSLYRSTLPFRRACKIEFRMSASSEPNTAGSTATKVGTPSSTLLSGEPAASEPEIADTPSVVKANPSPIDPTAQSSTPTASSSSKEKPLFVAADVATPTQFAPLKATYKEIEDARKAAHEKQAAERAARMAQPGWTRKDEATFGIRQGESESSKLFSKIWALRLPHPQPLQWALLELSADFKSAHAGNN